MDLLGRVGQENRDQEQTNRMGLFQPEGRKAAAMLLAGLRTSLRFCLGGATTFDLAGLRGFSMKDGVSV
jgi:hypothetical protein